MILCENKRILRKKGSENFEANKRNACETDLCSLRFEAKKKYKRKSNTLCQTTSGSAFVQFPAMTDYIRFSFVQFPTTTDYIRFCICSVSGNDGLHPVLLVPADRRGPPSETGGGQAGVRHLSQEMPVQPSSPGIPAAQSSSIGTPGLAPESGLASSGSWRRPSRNSTPFSGNASPALESRYSRCSVFESRNSVDLLSNKGTF